MDTSDSWQPAYKEWIERICAQNNVTATEIARRIGASPSSITRQIRPEWTRRPSLDILRRISNAFRTPIPTVLIGTAPAIPGFGEPDAVPVPFDHSEGEDFDANLSDWEIRSNSLAAMGCVAGDMIRFDARIAPVAGDIVIAQVYKVGAAGADTVMRLYMPPYLMAAEIGQPSIRPIVVDADGERVRIMGTMVRRWSLRRSNASAA